MKIKMNGFDALDRQLKQSWNTEVHGSFVGYTLADMIHQILSNVKPTNTLDELAELKAFRDRVQEAKNNKQASIELSVEDIQYLANILQPIVDNKPGPQVEIFPPQMGVEPRVFEHCYSFLGIRDAACGLADCSANYPQFVREFYEKAYRAQRKSMGH